MAKNKIKATINADSVNNAPIGIIKVEDTVLLELCVLKAGELVDFTNQNIYISALRSDNSLIQQESFITVEKTKLMIQLNEKFNQVAGIVRMELTAKDQEGITTTADFYLRVNSRILNNAIEKGDYIETLDKVKQDFIISSNTLIEELKSNSNLTFIEFREQFEELKQDFLTEAEKVREEFRIKGNTTIQAFYNSTQEVLHEFDVLGLQAIEIFNTEGNNAIEEVRARGQAIEDYFRENIANYKGDKGDKGDRGEKGDTGATGLTGAKGDTGAKGEHGLNGKDGINGAPGRDGINGKDGKDAVVVNSFEGGADEALSVEKGGELNTRVTQLEDLSMFYQSKEAEGTVTWTNSYVGDIKDLIIKGKTVGGYNSETQQYDTIVSSCEVENNILKLKTSNFLNVFPEKIPVEMVKCSVNNRKLTFLHAPDGRCVFNGVKGEAGNIVRIKITRSASNGGNHTLFLLNADGVSIGNVNKDVVHTGIEKDGFYMFDTVLTKPISEVIIKNYFGEIDIEDIAIATDYVPYVGQKVEVKLPCVNAGLIGAQNSYNGETGKYIELARQHIVVASDRMEFVQTNDFDGIAVYLPSMQSKEVICDRFRKGSDFGCFYVNPANVVLKYEKGTKTYQQMKEDIIGSTWAYHLKSPIVHNIEKLPPLKSYKGTTHITLDNEVKGNISAKVKVDLSAVATALEEENKQLRKQVRAEQEIQDNNITTTMLANTELFEMLLMIMPQKIGKGGEMRMVEVYVTLIIQGDKTLEQVPSIIRPQVEAKLRLLGVIA